MNCPVCNSKDTKVTDSRISTEGMAIRRRRECMKCAFRFSTLEKIAILDLAIIKRNGRREPYDREKLISGLKQALQKRPITSERFHKLVNSIEVGIQKKRKNELTSEELGEIVMSRLQKFDKVGYIRFASVYRSFEDVKSFQRELQKISNGKKSSTSKKIKKTKKKRSSR